MRERIVFGDRWLDVELPDETHEAPAGIALPLAPVEDLTQTVRECMQKPLDLPPLREEVHGGSTVTVAFDDPTVPCYAPVWSTAIPIVLEELEQAGVRREDVTLLCANALHRKFTEAELGGILGGQLVREFGPRLVCHDAEDPENLSYLGTTPSGYEVEVNRLVADSDLTIY